MAKKFIIIEAELEDDVDIDNIIIAMDVWNGFLNETKGIVSARIIGTADDLSLDNETDLGEDDVN